MGIKKIIEAWGRSTFVHVACSFVLMGGWATFANWSHAMPAALYAGLLQGVLSGMITLVMKKALERTFSFWLSRARPGVGLVATPLMVCSISASSLAICHVIAGTPELLATIAVPSSVALFYAFTYTFSMWRQEGRGRTV